MSCTPTQVAQQLVSVARLDQMLAIPEGWAAFYRYATLEFAAEGNTDPFFNPGFGIIQGMMLALHRIIILEDSEWL